MAASAVVYLHDFLLPVATGIDWQPILSMLPDWAWPLILFGAFALIKWFRALRTGVSQRRTDAMWQWLASFLTGPIVNGAIEAYKAKLDAMNSQDRLAADLTAKEIEARSRRESRPLQSFWQSSCKVLRSRGTWRLADGCEANSVTALKTA
jgi:hypothetical protein